MKINRNKIIIIIFISEIPMVSLDLKPVPPTLEWQSK